MSYHEELYQSYAETHADALEGDLEERQSWSDDYFRQHYLPLIARHHSPDANVLEIGCGKGLMMVAMQRAGFSKLSGIDLSAPDVEIAKSKLPHAQIELADAAEFLGRYPATFDIVLMKAVLEHIPKVDTIPLLQQIGRSLTPNGAVIIDVPNMDWLFASHERYMDFTHEVGFTLGSLSQVMSQVFTHVETAPIDHRTYLTTYQRIRATIAHGILHRLLYWIDPQGAGNAIWARSIVGYARDTRSAS